MASDGKGNKRRRRRGRGRARVTGADGSNFRQNLPAVLSLSSAVKEKIVEISSFSHRKRERENLFKKKS
jgi:hypothetical protein